MSSDSHGNSIAAWSAVCVALLGMLLASIDLMTTNSMGVLFWIGMVLLPISLVVGTVLSKMGFGVDG